MTSASPVRQLADALIERLLAADPFEGSALGLREYDALMPDASAAGRDALAADLESIATQARSVQAETEADTVTLDVIRAECDRRRLSLAMALDEFTVTPMPIVGAPALLATLARTQFGDARGAQDYLTRLQGAARWLDQSTERLREGAAAGRFPVGSLLDNSQEWLRRALADPVPAAITAPQAPDGWDGAQAWRDAVADTAREQIVPALRRWGDRLTELRPSARPDDRPGLCFLPGGDDDYARAIAVHTTLSFSADELHRIGLAEVERLEERARELGAQIGLADLAAVHRAARASTERTDVEAALAEAQEAVRRGEARAGEIMPQPLPGPCAVTAMPRTVAESGMAPHYTRPLPETGRPGTYWFNTIRATAGTGWDLEAVAFHETVPGHHSQVARTQQLPDLPLLQQLSITVHAEGWGLYAEHLAGEFGLYSGVEAEIGAVFAQMHRAARLVVDTGLHAQGWSRQQARDYLLGHVAMSAQFLTDEIDRYIAWPGQALAYLVGRREILRLRDRARRDLGDAFDLPTFNGVLLDSGGVHMPVLSALVGRWIATEQQPAS